MKNKIFLLTNSLLRGGTERQVVYISEYLQINYEISVLVFYGNQIEDDYKYKLEHNGIKIHLLEGYLFSKLLKIYKLVFKNKPFILYSFLLTTNIINAFLSVLFPRTFNIGSIRSSYLPHNKMIINKLLHNFFFDYTIINNLAGIDNLTKRGFKQKKFNHIPNFIYIPNDFLKKDKPEVLKILSVGRFDISKDYTTALQAIKSLVDRNGEKYKVIYTIVGYGNLQYQIEKLITQLVLDKNVKLVINPESVLPFYQSSDIYLSTSIFEGLSNSILEAMSYSLPIIATDVGDNNLLVKNNINGFLVKVRDIEHISDKLNYFIYNKELLASFGKASKEILINKFNADTIQKQYIELFESLAK